MSDTLPAKLGIFANNLRRQYNKMSNMVHSPNVDQFAAEDYLRVSKPLTSDEAWREKIEASAKAMTKPFLQKKQKAKQTEKKTGLQAAEVPPEHGAAIAQP